MRDEPRWRRYLRLWGYDAGADVEDELSFHLEERTALNQSLGLPPERARADAMRRFGDVARIRAECMSTLRREERRMELGERIGDLARDVRLALRSLVRSPLYAAAAGAALALGIGAGTAVFTIVSAVLLTPLPYANPDRVVAVHNAWEGSPEARLSPAEYLDHAERTRAFAAFGVYAKTFVNLVEEGGAERLPAAIVTPSAFAALGVTAAQGRLFEAAEGVPGGPAVAVLSHELWHRRFDGARDVVGRSLDVNGSTMTIVGVLPEDVRLPDGYSDSEPPVLFVPYALDRASVSARGSHFLSGVARLAPGWTLETASREVSRVAREMATTYPDDYPAEMRFDASIRPAHTEVAGGSRRLLLLLSGAVGLVLLIACANVTSLVLTRTEDRRRELAVRSALGAGRWRIARQLITEHLVLALAAGAVGLMIAFGAVEALAVMQPDIPRLDEVNIDARVLMFTAGLSILATLIVAIAPLRLGLVAPGALREGSARTTSSHATQHVRRVLIASEVALSIVLIAGAGLLLRSFTNLLAVDPGYRTEDVLTVPISLPSGTYPDDDSRRRFFAQLVGDAARLPGVTAAGAVSNLPLASNVGDLNIYPEGEEVAVADGDISPRLDWQVVTPGCSMRWASSWYAAA